MRGQVQPEYVGGGFGDAAGIRARMSEPLQRAMAEQDAREAQEAAKEARRQEQIAASYQERAIASAIQEAHARGELVSVHEAYRTNGASLGHTVSEFIQLSVAKMDAEDAQHEAAERAAFRRWQLERSADMSCDTSAPTPAEKVEIEESTARAERNAQIRRTRTAEARSKAKERRELDQRIVRYARSTIRNTRAMEGW